MKICPRLLIFELLDSTLRRFRGYDFSIFLDIAILYFGVFDSDLRASPPMLSYGVPSPTEIVYGHYFDDE